MSTGKRRERESSSKIRHGFCKNCDASLQGSLGNEKKGSMVVCGEIRAGDAAMRETPRTASRNHSRRFISQQCLPAGAEAFPANCCLKFGSLRTTSRSTISVEEETRLSIRCSRFGQNSRSLRIQEAVRGFRCWRSLEGGGVLGSPLKTFAGPQGLYQKHVTGHIFCALSIRARLLLTAILAFLFIWGGANAETTVVSPPPVLFRLATVGRVVGANSDAHRLSLSLDNNGADLLRLLRDAADPQDSRFRGTDPSVGVSAWNPVEKILFYASAEDGYASAYVQPFSYTQNVSLVQRFVRGRTDTSFTLTSIQFNAATSLLYGLVTYSSGEHFLIRMNVDTRPGFRNVQVTFEALLQIEPYSHIAPGLSALDTTCQVYYGVGIKTLERGGKQQGFLFALHIGEKSACVTGSSPPYKKWERELPGVLTSLNTDPNTGNLYGMLHNVSGHFLLHFDPSDTGRYWGQYTYQKGKKPDPSAMFNYTSDTEVVFGLSTFSPSYGTGRESTQDYFSVVHEQVLDENGTEFTQYVVYDQNLGNVNGELSGKEQFLINTKNPYTLVSMQIAFTTIPILTMLVPSTAHIVGGMQVTVIGLPFVDTGAANMRCRWKTYTDQAMTELSKIYLYSTRAFFVNTSTVVCISPALPSRAKSIMDFTLTDGSIWTQNTRPFTFWQTTQRAPIVGSSKGKTLVLMKGIYLSDLQVTDNDYIDNSGRASLIRSKVSEAQCEFGAAPQNYVFNDQAQGTGSPTFKVSGNAPVGPVFQSTECKKLTIGVLEEEVCVISCVSPQIPHKRCVEGLNPLYTATRTCNTFRRRCPELGDYINFDQAAVVCEELVPAFSKIPFAFTTYGQRVSLGTWSFVGSQSPIVLGAKFTSDGTGIIVLLDLNTNQGRSIGGLVPTTKFIMNADVLFGIGSYSCFIVPNRFLITFGNRPTVSDRTFFEFRPASLALYTNWFRFASGLFAMKTLTDNEKPRPVARIIAPGSAGSCNSIKVSAGASSFSGGRPFGHRWGFRASKCIDFMCLNSVALDPKQHIWMLPGQRALFYKNAAEFDVGSVVSPRSFEMASNNRFTWLLQVTNFFYASKYYPPSRMVAGNDLLNLQTCTSLIRECKGLPPLPLNLPTPGVCMAAEAKCNLCALPDFRICPAISTVAQKDTLLHWAPVPFVKIASPDFIEVQSGTALPVSAEIFIPDSVSCGPSVRPSNSDITKLLAQGRTLYETFEKTQSMIKIRWTLVELALRKLNAATLHEQHMAAGSQEEYTGNRVDLEIVETGAGLIILPSNMLKPGHYYALGVHATMSNFYMTGLHQNGSDTVLIYVKRAEFYPRITLSNNVLENKRFLNDNIFITVPGKGPDALRISANETQGLSEIPDSATATYTWNCRKWRDPCSNTGTECMGTAVDLKLTYWVDDTDFEPDERLVSKCFFNDTLTGTGRPYPTTEKLKRQAFPCCNRLDFDAYNVELEHRMTYEFEFTMIINYSNDYKGKDGDIFQTVQRFTVLSSESSDFFSLGGRSIQIDLKMAGSPNMKKVNPGEDLILYADVPRASVNLALASWGGKCESPSRLNQAACKLEVKEIGNGLDLSLSNITESPTLFYIKSYPEPMTIKIKPEMVVPGNRFVFRLSIQTVQASITGADNWIERGFAELMLEVNRAPRGGVLVVSPSDGKAFLTDFAVEAAQFEDDAEDLPLTYTFYYTLGDAEDQVYVSDQTQVTKLSIRLPMTEQMAKDAPCDGSSYSDKKCAVLRMHVLVTDVLGAKTTSTSSRVSLTLDSEVIKYPVAAGLIDGMRRQAFLSKSLGYAPFCNSLRAVCLIAQHSAFPTIFKSKEATTDDNAVLYENFLLNPLDTMKELANNPSFFPTTPATSLLLLQAFSIALKQDTRTLNMADMQALFGFLGIVSSRLNSVAGSTELLESMLKTSAELVQKILSIYDIPGIASRRRLLALTVSQQDVVEFCFSQFSKIVAKVCYLESKNGATDRSGTKRFSYPAPLDFFSVACRKVPGTSDKKTVEEFVKESTKCGRVQVSMRDWKWESDTVMAITVFGYNALSYPAVKTANSFDGAGNIVNGLDGKLQSLYKIQWPLHEKSCPVMVQHVDMAGALTSKPPYDAIEILFDVPQEVAIKTFKESADFVVFKDVIFSATCQQWLSSNAIGDVNGNDFSKSEGGAWFIQGSTVNIQESDPNFMCNTTHWPRNSLDVPPPLASGKVNCTFGNLLNKKSYTTIGLYGVITEPTDCAGRVDIPSRLKPEPAQNGWKRGQWSYIESAESERQACDRCKVCGGVLDSCSLTCSSKVGVNEVLDLCGVCGGVCTLASGCTKDQCPFVDSGTTRHPYFRWIGDFFPPGSIDRDWDVNADGLTGGLLKQGRICQQETTGETPVDKPPADSPNGKCRSISQGDSINLRPFRGRVERYPYNNNLEKTCWENSPTIPKDSPDKLCAFARGAFFIDDPDGEDRKLMVEALNHNGKVVVEEVDLLLRFDSKGLSTFEANGTRSLEIPGTAAAILSSVDQLRYQPALNWNSLYPPARYRKLKFSIEKSQIPPIIIQLRIKPVNDPPRLTASPIPYRIQEDRITRLNPAIQIVDDAADVAGHFLNVSLQVRQKGARIRTASSPKFSEEINISGTLEFLNKDFITLDYLGPENSNDDFYPKDNIFVTVNDNGYGGEHPYNMPMQSALVVNLTLVIQNDPPITMIEKKSVILEGTQTRIKGAHIVDIDAFQHTCDANKRPSDCTDRFYEAGLESAVGRLSVPIMKTNCSVIARKPFNYVEPSIWKYVDQTAPTHDFILASSVAFLKLDGRPGKRKAVYLSFDIDFRAVKAALAYENVKFVFSMFKHDCYDIAADKGQNAKDGTTWRLGCQSSGSFPVSLVPCVISERQEFTYNLHEAVKGKQIGMMPFTARRSEWIYTELDSQTVSQELKGGKALCLRLDPVSAVNETIRFLASVTTTAARKSSTEENFLARLEIHMGAPVNISFFSLHQGVSKQTSQYFYIIQGCSLGDSVFIAQAELFILNKLFDDFEYRITEKYSNRLGGDVANVTFSVEDISARKSCLAAEEEFGYQACEIKNYANASVYILPIKHDPSKDGTKAIHMQPWYHEQWMRLKSVQGSFPAYIQLEDCGNRAWLEDCPYRLQIMPAIVSGEYPLGRLTVEISSRLGTVTVPQNLRGPLTFEKGTGFRDEVVRMTGFVADIRIAIMDMIYHTKLDEHTEYMNLFASEKDLRYSDCSRICFINDIGGQALAGEDPRQGCDSTCPQSIFRRVNRQLIKKVNEESGKSDPDENGVFLDDLVITFSDNGNTGVGLDKYTTLVLYNIYSLAVNDRPCIIFKGKVSSGCRKDCAHPGLPINCYSSGLPFDLQNSFKTRMWEGQTDPILVGGLVAKVVDEYEVARKDCRDNLDDELGKRGDDVTPPNWLVECPTLNVKITADKGNVALNSRQFIEIFLGAEKTFVPSIAFLGFARDSNAALRMIRYTMSEENKFFNSNLGTEVVRIAVSDQGYSGADTTGEFSGTSSESVLEFVIDIDPVNNLPDITVPRASDPIEVQENVPTQLSKNALLPGLNIQDVDSDECGKDGLGYGIITTIVKVNHGRIYINPMKTPTLEALPATTQESAKFLVDPECSESQDCAPRSPASSCKKLHRCYWDDIRSMCTCKFSRKLGQKCNRLKFRGLSADIQNIIRTMVYVPPRNTNYLNFPEEPEVLNIQVSDKRDPEDETNKDVSCGATLIKKFITWKEGFANIRVTPVSQPAIVTIDPLIINSGFEFPSVCEGNLDCEFEHVDERGIAQCTGILPRREGMSQVTSLPPVTEFGWQIINGIAGLSHLGWSGDVAPSDGEQHMFLNPNVDDDAIVNQTINSLVLGARYKVIVSLAAKTTGNRGAGFRLTLSADFKYYWAKFYPEISRSLVVSLPGKEKTEFETAEFFAHRPDINIELRSFVDSTMTPAGSRLVFVDGVRFKFLSYSMLEDNALMMKGVRVVDPDNVPGVINAMKRSSLEFNLKVTIEAKYGRFELITDKCTVAPPNVVLDPDNGYRRVNWGVLCWKFTNNPAVSEWANKTGSIRPDCPEGWAGRGTEEQPCVNLPIKRLNATFLTPYYSNMYPQGQVQIPERYIELTGSVQGLEDAIRNRIRYVPDANFNTDNQGKETLKVTSNDLSNFNGNPNAPNIRVQYFDVNIKAVNDPPNITFASPSIAINEDFSTIINGITVSDPDVNEILCLAEPCLFGQGIMTLRISARNGTITVAPKVVATTLISLRASLFNAIFTDDQFLQDCLMLLSCRPRGGYLTLSSMTLEEFCVANIDRCPKVSFYCGISDMVNRDKDADICLSQLSVSGFIGAAWSESPSIVDAEKKLQDRMESAITMDKRLLMFKDGRSVIVGGTLNMVNNLLNSKSLTYTPNKYYNGLESVEFEVNDIGNSGIGYPCDMKTSLASSTQTFDEVPQELLFEYCMKKASHKDLSVQSVLSIKVIAINNLPVLEMYDNLGANVLDAVQPMLALQNITRILNRMRVVDVDIVETKACDMEVGFSTKSAGKIAFNMSKAPRLKYSENPLQTEIVGRGSLNDIQIFVSNIEYRSDPVFSGVEVILVSLNDNKCTGIDLVPRPSLTESFLLEVVVSRPKLCRFPTCETCLKSMVEDCGWCPSSCSGKGSCKEAVSKGGKPKVGVCEPYCTKGVCLTWNMCNPAPDISWTTGAIGAPIVFVSILWTYFFFMWTRRHYGTIPIYFAKTVRTLKIRVTHFAFSPQDGAQMVQLMYLAVFVVIAALLPGVFQDLLRPKKWRYTLGEAASFRLQTDACKVMFVSDRTKLFSAAADIEGQISANGTLENVMLFTDFCAEDQYILVNNSRVESIRYAGYTCDIWIYIPYDPQHTIPPMTISNVGSQMTTIATTSDDQTVNFEPNLLIVEGTMIKMNINNLRVRAMVVKIHSGDIKLTNMTFARLEIETNSADISISVSPISTMFVPINLLYRQPKNSICFVSYLSDEFSLQNTCNSTLREVITTLTSEDLVNGERVVTETNVSRFVRDWACEKDSMAVLVPFFRDLQPGLANIDVSIRSNTGQIFFQSIPPDRVPPRSGRGNLDQLYVHDGLHGSRTPALESSAAKNLDVQFHPGGANSPNEQWFEVRLLGPSAPLGTFVWVSDIRYLILSRELLHVLSVGLLTPRQARLTLPLKPALCPEFDSGLLTDFVRPNTTTVSRIKRRSNPRHVGNAENIAGQTKRKEYRRSQQDMDMVGNTVKLVQLYRVVFETVNGKNMPPTSFIAFFPRSGSPIIFEVDPQTGKSVPKGVSLSDYPLTGLLLAFGLVLPIIIATCVMWIVVSSLRVDMEALRQRKVDQHLAATRLLHCLEKSTPEEFWADEQREVEAIFAGKVSIFYYLDCQWGDPDSQKSAVDLSVLTFLHVMFIGVAFVPLLVFAQIFKQSRTISECAPYDVSMAYPLEAQPYDCSMTWSLAEYVILVSIISYCVMSIFALYSHYSNMKWSPFLGVIRSAFYSVSIIMSWGSIIYLFVVVTWIFIGLFIQPSQFMPHVTGIFGGLSILMKFFARNSRIFSRTRSAVQSRTQKLSERSHGHLPIEVVAGVVDRTLERILKKYKVAVTTLILDMTIIFTLILFVLVFFSIGMAALTDTTSMMMGVFNALVMAIAMLTIDKAVNAKKDKELQAQDLEAMVKDAYSESIVTLKFLKNQIEVGVKMLEAAEKEKQKKMEDGAEAGADLTAADLHEVNAMVQFMKSKAKQQQKEYEFDNNLAKRVINEDKFTRDGGRLIPVYVENETRVSEDVSMMYDDYKMFILLCEQDDDFSPQDLQTNMAQVFKVDPKRFAVQIRDI